MTSTPPVEIAWPTLWCNPWQVQRMAFVTPRGPEWVIHLSYTRGAWWRGPREDAYETALKMWRAWIAGDYCADDPRLDQLRRQVLTQLPTIAGRPLRCDCPDGMPCHAGELAEMARTSAGAAKGGGRT